MSDNNLFKIAVELSETNEFFKGEGRYFVRDPNWGEHVYAAHYGSWVDTYINQSDKECEIFSNSFCQFLDNLNVNSTDLDHFFGNLNAVAFWMEEGKLQNVDIFNVDSNCNKSIQAYLLKLKGSNLELEKKDLIGRYIDGIKGKGFDLPVS